jgi:predicted proteasome-type protease
LTLFLLFQSTAGDVIPLCWQISSHLLDQVDVVVTEWLKVELQDKYVVMMSDGWKDDSRNAMTGVNLSVGGKVRFPTMSTNIQMFTFGLL